MRTRADRLVHILYWVTGIGGIAYVVDMFVAPLFITCADWECVQDTWDRWQSLNVGVLAFMSSVIALSISRLNAKNQKERQFIAARAFLPHELSELCRYFKQSAAILEELWDQLNNPHGSNIGISPSSFPQLPESYKEVFSRCIEYADSEVGDRLAYILMRLQVIHSRMSGLKSSLTNDTNILVKENIKTYLLNLGELQALINQLFPFARGLESFDNGDLAWADYQNAYANLDLWLSDFDDLEGFTKRAIERAKSS